VAGDSFKINLANHRARSAFVNQRNELCGSSRTGTRPTINSSRRPPPDDAAASATAATAAASKAASATAASVEASAATHCVAAAVAAAATAPVAAAAAVAAAASDKLEVGSGFPVEDVERRQADVKNFFLTEGEFVTRFDGPRGQIWGGADRLCDCAARQRQKSSGSQHGYGLAPTLSLRSLLRVRHGRASFARHG
jgi:hypothetical protein